MSAVHAGGGAADEPGQAAILTAAHPALEYPRPARSCIQPSQAQLPPRQEFSAWAEASESLPCRPLQEAQTH